MNEHDTEKADVLLETSRFRVERIGHGSGDQRRVREIVRHPGAVAIVPVVDDDHICLIRNHRVAVGRELIEIPAGTLEPGEEPLETAVRELQEETGYRADDMSALHSFFLSPGILDERMHLFVARKLTAGPPAREPGELIENLVVTNREAIDMVRRGEIEDAKTIVGLAIYLGL